MVYGDTQTSGKRERLIYAHIDRALAAPSTFNLHLTIKMTVWSSWPHICGTARMRSAICRRKCEIIGGGVSGHALRRLGRGFGLR